MVRFTVLCRSRGSDVRMEFPGRDPVSEVGEAVSETLGCGGFMLRNGYTLLLPDMEVGSCISEGDVVEVIPDPEAFFR